MCQCLLVFKRAMSSMVFANGAFPAGRHLVLSLPRRITRRHYSVPASASVPPCLTARSEVFMCFLSAFALSRLS